MSSTGVGRFPTSVNTTVNPGALQPSRSRYQEPNTPGGVSQDEVPQGGSARHLDDVIIPFNPAGEYSPQNEESPSAEVTTSVDGARSSQTVSPAEYIREIELVEGGVMLLVVRHGACYAITYAYDTDVPPNVSEAAAHLTVLSRTVADAPDNVTLGGAIDQIRLAGYAEPLEGCSLEEMFEPEPDPRTEPDSGNDGGGFVKDVLPYAAIAGALYVINEAFG